MNETTAQIVFRTPVELWMKLRKEADRQGLTLSAFCRQILHNAMYPNKRIG